MPTLKQERVFENDAFGRTRPGAKIYTYEAGTNTQKATYTDVALKYENPWPLVADGAGVFPQAFLASGGYKLVYTDSDDVQFDERDNINVAEKNIITTSDFYFSTLVDLKQGISINGDSINLQVGQVARTVGNVTETDGIGAEWLIVAAGTGSADDDLYADLDNGLQAQRLFNQLYTDRNLGEIADAGSSAQAEARTNIGAQAEPAAISGYLSANSFYITDNTNSSAFSISSAMSELSWESVGPTGSGATNIWTALDDLPLETSFIEVLCDMFDSSGGSTLSISVYSRKNGESDAFDSSTEIANIRASSTLVTLTSLTPAKIPLSSSNVFDIGYNTNTGSGTASIYLRGFGV